MASGAVAVQAEKPARSIPVFGIIVGLIVVGMAILVIYPVIRLFYSVFVIGGDVNTSEIVKTIVNPNFPPTLRNTALLILGGGTAAMVVGSFTSVSLDPPLVAFFPDRGSSSWPKLEAANRFCVNILSAEQEAVCRTLASKDPDKFTNQG